ncbi:RNA polymerase sigma factor [Streptomyces milbemycinicus]|uniref:Sigma-70 family RNA polymerase sigma factor n=1 Tax=Streptomyces milbemycinicus TaxID=476552 RepID=A0ABW8LJ75_9ACTN
MRTEEQSDAAVVAAARAGDQRALAELLEEYLPLVYNVVGRALDGHADVDDVVQETMERAVTGLAGLADPERFRSWLVAIALNQVRQRWREGRARARAGQLEEAVEVADPGADFAEVTVLRLGLSGQRREVVEATRWLERDEREVLSLWWLEAAGELTRAELAAACELAPKHAAVRVQRVKSRLDTARGVVRALRASPRCPELSALVKPWNGRPSALWRKRLARHIGQCPRCGLAAADLVPAEGLLVGLALVPLPAGLAAYALGQLASGTPAVAAAGATAASKTAGGKLAQLLTQATAKPVVAVAAAGGLAVAATALYVQTGPGSAPDPGRPPSAAASTAPVVPEASAAAPTGEVGEAVSRPPSRRPKSSRSASASAVPRSLYGTVVDKADAAPAVSARPGPLPERPEGRAITGSGSYEQPGPGRYVMVNNAQYVTLTGQGYVLVRWQLVPAERSGRLRMPSWTGLSGRLFHVASGGGRRMDDQMPGAADRPHTWMGSAATGFDTLPAGAQQMWQNEYYYLDGSVTLHLNEDWADYNLTVSAVDRAKILQDVSQPPGDAAIRYGLVRDTGTDAAPVPQYVTRSRSADPVAVPLHGDLR